MGQQESKPTDVKEIIDDNLSARERQRKRREQAELSIKLAKERREKRELPKRKELEEIKEPPPIKLKRKLELEEVKEEDRVPKRTKINVKDVVVKDVVVKDVVKDVKIRETKIDIPFTGEMSKNIDISDINICKLFSYITKVKGFPSNSASPTDTWNITFKNNIISDTKFVSDGFLKIYIDPKSIKPVPAELIALNYELQVYRDVIKPLINNNICPNFVRFISSGEGCSYDDLLNFLTGKLEFNGKLLNNQECKQNLDRNIYIIKNQDNSRPAIQNVNGRKITYLDKLNLKYNMILNENIKNATTLFDWIKIFNTDISTNLVEFWNILFQACYACYCMSLSKMVHNDLHSGNIFIEDLKKPVQMVYVVNGNKILIETRYKALIYDFDRAYVERLGRNKMIEGGNCSIASQCNIYIENKDIVKILCYVYNNVPYELKSQILKLISNSPDEIREIKNVYELSRCFLQERNNRGDLVSKNISFYSRINSTDKILSNIVLKMRNIAYDKNKKYPVFSCNKDYFNRDGTLNYKEIQKYKDTSKVIKNNIDDEVKIQKERQEKERLERKSQERKLLEREKQEREIIEKEKQEKERKRLMMEVDRDRIERERLRISRQQEFEREERSQERRLFMENALRRSSNQYSDNLIMTNYRINTTSLLYITTPIPQNILNDGRITTYRIVIDIANRIINNNQYYLRFFNGEIIEGLTTQIILDEIGNTVVANNNLILEALRNVLGPFWIPMYTSPINIDTVDPVPMSIESPPSEGMEIDEDLSL